ncbi:expansin [Marchantia polymorpha subsp. ruderalis]|nr:hypothetical protein MARPO_0137s0021 [Marchantia polymorpha]BBN02842.1 hypothetical protein Mp_2g18600 [Marchantia polymorpha subsp. ruderalis]|eukprot:PTQ29653.1 hypothetical protein MARPO_0137s0021 [Marchantia polymorpha]
MTTMIMKGSGVGFVATLFASILLILNNGELTKAYDPYAVATTSWMSAKATFYGGQDASGTMNGGCGYANPFTLGYGAQTAALSNALFNKGLTCGACFEIKCAITATAYAKQWCYANSPSIYITATNLCPQGSYGGWCNGANLHFDLAYAAFTKLARENAGVIPVNYRRTPCKKSGGIKFQLNGNTYWNLVLIYNVGGGGNVAAAAIKGSRSNFYTMNQNWGMNWESYSNLVGQALTFKITLGNGRSATFYNVAPAGWRFGQTYQAAYNF